jgi:hypothetical protein
VKNILSDYDRGASDYGKSAEKSQRLSEMPATISDSDTNPGAKKSKKIGKKIGEKYPKKIDKNPNSQKNGKIPRKIKGKI